MHFYLSLAILAFMEGALIFKRSFLKKHAKAIFVFSIAVIFLVGLYYSFDLYSVWKTNPVTAAMLPPTSPINYFIFYVFVWAFAPYVLSLMAALVFFLAFRISNKKSGEKYFENEEPWFAATAIFLCSWPGWLVYLVCLILIYLLIHLFSKIKAKFLNQTPKSERIPLYYLWVPLAIFVIVACQLWLPAILPFWSKLLL
ncbi:MAG TPA: hypothetical protein PKG74_00270 [Candidatus Colwellbacteria bacterium]|nr:hypothetical protein [Candidatus Colwellbacteria bacterium]